jgi:hypothetical protein
VYDNLFPSLGNASASGVSKMGASRRSDRDVEDCYADQSKPNEIKRGLRVAGGALLYLLR